jgi:hypothetical protein
MADKTMTVADFRRLICNPISHLPDDTEIVFGQGDLRFYRLKNRGYLADDQTPSLVQIEFNELYELTLDPDQE